MDTGASATFLSPFIAQGIHPNLSTLVNQQAGGRRYKKRRGRARTGVKVVIVPMLKRGRRR
jgi:hypothetical protein